MQDYFRIERKRVMVTKVTTYEYSEVLEYDPETDDLDDVVDAWASVQGGWQGNCTAVDIITEVLGEEPQAVAS